MIFIKDMIDQINENILEIESFESNSKEEIESFRIKFLSKKGLINFYFSEFRNIDNSQKKEYGQAINKLKKTAQDKLNLLNNLTSNITEKSKSLNDLSRPWLLLDSPSKEQH